MYYFIFRKFIVNPLIIWVQIGLSAKVGNNKRACCSDVRMYMPHCLRDKNPLHCVNIAQGQHLQQIIQIKSFALPAEVSRMQQIISCRDRALQSKPSFHQYSPAAHINREQQRTIGSGSHGAWISIVLQQVYNTTASTFI